MTLGEYFDTIDLIEIDRYISDKQEENLNLEFKTVNHPDYNDQNRDDDKKNISKAISGFANSNGGIVIWGIKAQANSQNQDVAKEKKPIKELTKFLNLLNRLEGQAVTPTVKGIIHKKIESNNDIGFVKTYIPPSEIAPHIANYAGKHYYKRSGDSFYICEHYDIIDMFSRKKSPKLRLKVKILPKEVYWNNRNYDNYRILISIANEGHNIAKHPYLALNFAPNVSAYRFGLDGNNGTGLPKVKNNVLFTHNYSGGVDNVIYPEAILDVNIFEMQIPNDQPPPNMSIEYMITAEDAEIIKDKIIIETSAFEVT